MSIWKNEYPKSEEYAHFYSDYVQLCPKKDILDTLKSQMHELYTLINTVPGDKAFFSYAEGKWTFKELIGHLIDTERVFAYRAFHISRGDTSPLPGMDQDVYAKNSYYNTRKLNSIANEYLAVRIANMHLFENMTKEMLSMKGTASNVEFTVRSLPYIIAGHELHHMKIIHERYL